MESAREARRRKVMERGSERLAFITGQSQSLTPSSSFSTSRPPTLQQQQGEEENPRSTTAVVLHHGDATGMEVHEHQPIDQTFSTAVEDDRTELLPEHEANRELGRHQTSSEFAKCKMGKRFQKVEMRKEAVANAEQDDKIAEFSTSPVAHGLSDQVADQAACVNLPMSHQVLTSKQISHAISASENIRLLCAVSIAILVVMSSHGHSLGGKILGSILNIRPLLLALLTDAMVIIGQLLLSQKSHIKEGEEAGRTRQEEIGFANNIGNALDVGLVFQKALNAAFMDCSICAVIMISGLFV
ncbi:uncharacterized protein [Elaeis guineensis]|uniref:Uncharacterized protein LOC105055795 n=1 Tax=Elaeis guineensis var. tenera TaxID=51953 RepID=A0A8N4ICQ6_ELAGV|nr:uncharacterized protein LOC105055795 [Elaeis guineensis]